MERPSLPAKPRVAITFCTQCRWLLRAAWMAQELLSTFGDDLGEVALVPGRGGVFAISVADETVWERVRDGGFPDVKALKQRVRDRIDPARDLGHVDAGRENGRRQDDGQRSEREAGPDASGRA